MADPQGDGMASAGGPAVEHPGPRPKRREVAGLVLVVAGLVPLIGQLVAFEVTPGPAPAFTAALVSLYVLSSAAILAGLGLLVGPAAHRVPQQSQVLLGVIAGILCPLFLVGPIGAGTRQWTVCWVYPLVAIAAGLVLRLRTEWKGFGAALAVTTVVVYGVIAGLGPL